MATPGSHDPQKLAYRIDEAVKASGLGRSFLYERLADGSLKSVKIGGRRLILHEDLLSFLRQQDNAVVSGQPVRQPQTSAKGEKQKDGALPGQFAFEWK